MSKVVYIDPQGGSGNLGMYDYELLSRIQTHEITFIGGDSYDYLPLKNIKCKYWFRYSKYNNSLAKGISYIATLIRIFIYCVIHRPSLVHIQWLRIPAFDITLYSMLKHTLGIKIVYTVHNILPHESIVNERRKYQRMYNLADALMVHTKKTKELLVRDFNIPVYKIHIAPHGPLMYRHKKEDEDAMLKYLRDKYDLNGKFVFALMGNQSEYKGSDLLIEAWAKSEVLRSDENARLIIAGRKASCFTQGYDIENIVCIDGLLSDLMFSSLLQIADVIVLPYRKIEQSGVLLSIIPLHKPYCTTDVGELAEPILQNNIGWIIPKINIDSIRNTLENILSNPKEVTLKSSNIHAWEKAKIPYDWNKSALITQQVYSDL